VTQDNGNVNNFGKGGR